jgi:hypothetical protein
MTKHAIAQQINSHLWDFGVGGATGCLCLDLLGFRLFFFLCFPIQIALVSAFLPDMNTPNIRLYLPDYTEKDAIAQESLYGKSF